ncbi:hypothetical protein A0J48_003045 [Sphaerospermopsis aphanizomenoides BCCUSP55]|uniref:hypothetical protein n=1 Tax=Sphaerospermopsis aphanizomenoides TaxID=459663 RepID=UPI0019072A61|nr:hypothetical protein [Sphaerospermopsis aphanizomenoides]MBK1986530.1 hypothetical protein [Sphaerospermopsis aphanizomenoides BCCUSP55]
MPKFLYFMDEKILAGLEKYSIINPADRLRLGVSYGLALREPQDVKFIEEVEDLKDNQENINT